MEVLWFPLRRSGATTRDGLFSLEVVACLEACSITPVMTVREIKVRELRA